MVQIAILGKNVDKAVFGSDLMKMIQETRSMRSRALHKEKTDFHLLLALALQCHEEAKWQECKWDA